MAPFDPYLSWLGIPPHEQPPNHYRLLGIVLFESNPQVIQDAADRQSLLVGPYQGGPYDEMCQRLLSEIAMAMFCLQDPQQKAGYDAQLQQDLAHRGERVVAAAPPPGSMGGTGQFAGPPPQFAAPAAPFGPPPGGGPTAPGQGMPGPAAMPNGPMMAVPPTLMSAPPGFAPAMPMPAVPVAMPVAAPFPTPVAKPVAAAAPRAVATPAAPPAMPPAAPQRPIDELESLTSEPTRRRRRIFGKKKKTDYTKEIIIGSVVAAVGILLLVVYAAVGNHPSGFNAISTDVEKEPAVPLRVKLAAERAEKEKKIALEKQKERDEREKKAAAAHTAAGGEAGGPLQPFGRANGQAVRIAPAASADDAPPRLRPMSPTPSGVDSAPSGGHVDAAPAFNRDNPDEVGGDNDPVMGKTPDPEKGKLKGPGP